jgi:hypothetical protein
MVIHEYQNILKKLKFKDHILILTQPVWCDLMNSCTEGLAEVGTHSQNLLTCLYNLHYQSIFYNIMYGILSQVLEMTLNCQVPLIPGEPIVHC